MHFLNAGVFPLDESQFRKMYKEMAAIVANSNLFTLLHRLQKQFNVNTKQVVRFLQREDLCQWDVIVVDVLLDNTVTCLAKQANVPVVSVK